MENKKYNQIIDNAYKNYCLKKGSEIGEYGCRPILLTKEEFINKIKTDDEFSEKWGLKIEERELSLEERLPIADKFNPLIREDCLTKTHHPDETEELKLQYRHEWLDSLGPNVVPQRRAISITYNNETIEIYE